MIIFFDNDIADDGMHALVQLVALVDERLDQIHSALHGVKEKSPLHEDGDDLAGFGFVACQRYMTEVAAQFDVSRVDALAAGPLTAEGVTIASIINGAANAWKHESEWHATLSRQEELGHREQRTVDLLANGMPEGGWDYKYVNALHAIAPEDRFRAVCEALLQWRDEVIAKSREVEGG